MPELIPAILAESREILQERLRLMEGVATCVQIDCLDGHFAPNKSFFHPQDLETSLEIELHLMVSDPMAVIEEWKRTPQVRRALWHMEIPTDHQALISRCRELGWECGLAISPETPVTKLAPYKDVIDEVLVLGVKPGFSGQTLIPSTLEKLSEVKHLSSGLVAGFDGGATRESIPDIIGRGAERLNVASAIFTTPDPAQTVRDILSLI